jgi:spermidine/putrescine transport system ATP-binding protein
VHVEVGETGDLVVEVPNHAGPQSVSQQIGARVHCVCTADAVRVLTRSPVAVISDPVVEPDTALSVR